MGIITQLRVNVALVSVLPDLKEIFFHYLNPQEWLASNFFIQCDCLNKPVFESQLALTQG